MIHDTTDALCSDIHTDIFFPPSLSEERTAPESQYYEIAKMVCEQCPLREPCERQGREEEFGVWGGWSPKDRKRGEYRGAKKLLPVEHHHVLPRHKADERVDIPSLKEALKSYTKRRPRISK